MIFFFDEGYRFSAIYSKTRTKYSSRKVRSYPKYICICIAWASELYFKRFIRVNTGLDTNKLIFFVFTDFISHMIDSCSLEVNKATLSKIYDSYEMVNKCESYLDSLFLCKHLFGFSNFVFFSDIIWPVFKCFVKFTNTDMAHFNKTSLKKLYTNHVKRNLCLVEIYLLFSYS